MGPDADGVAVEAEAEDVAERAERPELVLVHAPRHAEHEQQHELGLAAERLRHLGQPADHLGVDLLRLRLGRGQAGRVQHADLAALGAERDGALAGGGDGRGRAARGKARLAEQRVGRGALPHPALAHQHEHERWRRLRRWDRICRSHCITPC